MKRLSKLELRKVEAVESKTPAGHLALVLHDEATIKQMAPIDQKEYWSQRNWIVHLMHAHNALLDSSRSLEVKQAAASIEVSIDARLEAINAFLDAKIPNVPRKKKRAKRAAPKKSSKKAAPKKRATAKRAKLKRAKSRAKAA